MGGMRRRVIAGIGWRSAADVSQMLLQIGFTAVLARLLDIADFGLAAMCYLFLRFVRSLTDVGFGSAVIQSRTITEGQTSAIFLLQVAIKFGVTLLCIAAAPLGAAFFEEPRLAELIRVLAWMIVLDSLAFPETLLRKRLQFRGYSILEVASTVAGGAVGVVLAYAGFGVWSIIYRTLAQHAIHTAAIWPIARWRPVRPDFRGTASLVRFGFTMFGSGAVYFWSQNLAAIILGKLMGAEVLGLFHIAYNLALVPAQKVQSVLTTVLTPAYASAQDTAEALRRHVHASLFSLGAVFAPMMLGMAAVAPSLVVVVYGAKWREAGGLLAGLAVVGLLKGLEHVLRSVLVATGRAGTIFRITIAETLAALPLLALGTWWLGVEGTVGAYLLASAFAFALTAAAAQSRLAAPALLVRATWRSFLVAAAMAAGVALVPLALSAPPPATLAVQVALGVALYLVVRAPLLVADERRIVRAWPVVGRLIGST